MTSMQREETVEGNNLLGLSSPSGLCLWQELNRKSCVLPQRGSNKLPFDAVTIGVTEGHGKEGLQTAEPRGSRRSSVSVGSPGCHAGGSLLEPWGSG